MLWSVCSRRWCSTDDNGPQMHNLGPAELPPTDSEHVASTFLELATERFDSRFAARASGEEERSTLDHLQVILSRLKTAR